MTALEFAKHTHYAGWVIVTVFVLAFLVEFWVSDREVEA